MENRHFTAILECFTGFFKSFSVSNLISGFLFKWLLAGLCGGGMEAVNGWATEFPVALSFFPNAREQCFKEKLFPFSYVLHYEH